MWLNILDERGLTDLNYTFISETFMHHIDQLPTFVCFQWFVYKTNLHIEVYEVCMVNKLLFLELYLLPRFENSWTYIKKVLTYWD